MEKTMIADFRYGKFAGISATLLGNRMAVEIRLGKDNTVQGYLDANGTIQCEFCTADLLLKLNQIWAKKQGK